MKHVVLAVFFIASVAKCYDYDKVLRLSLLFYEAQRSGHLPANNRIPWRGDSATTDKGQNGEDLSGGYYDGNLTKHNITITIQFYFIQIFKQCDYLSVIITEMVVHKI